MHRSKSRDGAPTPGPVFMSSKQMADYLQDLRSHRMARPNGSRPPPSKFNTWSSRTSSRATESSAVSPLTNSTFQDAGDEVNASPPHVPEPQPHRRTSSAMSNKSIDEVLAGRPLVQPPRGREREISASTSMRERTPSVQYRENGIRQVEREEARALRLAMEQIDMKGEEELYNAALEEAAQLVWKHQNPNAPAAAPDAPYAYPGLAKKGAHQRVHSLDRGDQDLQNSQTKQRKRHSYGSSPSGSRSSSLNSPTAGSDSSVKANADFGSSPNTVGDKKLGQMEELSGLPAMPPHGMTTRGRRRSSSSRRKVSGSLFRNPDDQIYEEPEEETRDTTQPAFPPKGPAPLPLQVRRNPFSRVKFAKENLGRSNTDPTAGTNKLDRVEIQRNPPTQSRNAEYTLNPPLPKAKDGNQADAENEPEVRMKDGKEIRGDDIRAATSMRLKDRSPRLPTPTLVSNAPGRPIVSFTQDLKPKEIELKQEISTAPKVVVSDAPRPGSLMKTSTVPVVPSVSVLQELPKKFHAPAARGLQSNPLPPVDTSPLRTNRTSTLTTNPQSAPPTQPVSPFRRPSKFNTANSSPSPPVPTINVSEAPPPPPPTINISSAPPLPTINVSSAPPPRSRPTPPAPIPTINVSSTPIPTISIQETPSVPSISVTPTAPTISVDEPSTSTRPLPDPRNFRGKPPSVSSNSSRPHWTPGGPVRTGALCAHCALPIAGRIVSAAGSRFHPQCFLCHHCGEHLECVAFYPEPEDKRAQRIARIRARQRGEDIPCMEGVDMRDLEERDGDEGMRFYCHLDFHELFSPRCKSCKTPIEGEVVVACGAEWHVGHFFCAQCGDPFDSKTPFVEKDGYAWCVGCHTNRYSTKCRKCRKPVTDMVVKALGAEWHVDCFCCVECSGPFDDGRYFLRGNEEDPVCVRCEERRLKA